MAKAKPKAFFPSIYMAVIVYKKVDVWAERRKDFHPYFSTWKEAHDWQMTQAHNAVEAAKKKRHGQGGTLREWRKLLPLTRKLTAPPKAVAC